MNTANWIFVPSSDPMLTDDMYKHNTNDNLHITACFDGTFMVGQELDNGCFRFKDDFTSLESAINYAESLI